MTSAFTGTSRFLLVRELGAGGMGTVYEALDGEHGGRVALKLLGAYEESEIRAQALLLFKNEFRSLQEINHPNLVTLGELIEDDGRWFFTMELVDGVPFIDYVWPDSLVGPELDRERLRACLGQVVQGLRALHRAGKIHRDVKPSNVLVTPAGRVVILDFGLITDTAHALAARGVVGTAEYMAPEQVSGAGVGPAADWYSVGVMLYEALTRRLPFDGEPREIMRLKRHAVPVAPSFSNPHIPADLDRLCMELLAIDPAQRPDWQHLLARVGVRHSLAMSLQSLSSVAPGRDSLPALVGRDAELATLEQALDDSVRGAAVSVFVHGESGVGKTALLAELERRLGRVAPDVLVLHGRCYERETVPFKAFDGIVDALAAHLATLPTAEVLALCPPDLSVLAQLFPVLGRVPALADQPRPDDKRPLDLRQLRARAFGAFHVLLTALSQRRPVLICIDDFQWADDDSLALRRELMRQGGPGRLLVAGLRSSAETQEWLRHALAKQDESDVRHVYLEPLEPSEARALAELLLADLGERNPGSAAGIAAEAGGHPLLIEQLVRDSIEISETRTSLRRVTLEDALARRLERLDPERTRLLDLVSVAAAPISQAVAAQAAGVELGDFSTLVALLRVAGWVRTSGPRPEHAIEPHNDRLRRAVLERLTPERLTACHRALAEALTAQASHDEPLLLIHWLGAGEPARAAAAAERAAEAAFSAFAFERAARLYQQALALLPEAERPRLWPRAAEALANAGRTNEAADLYLAALHGADPEDAVELERRAAEQLLASGRIDEGLTLLRNVLVWAGMPLPSSPRAALRSLLERGEQLRVRGLEFHERPAAEVDPRLLARVDASWSASVGLALIDHVRAADFQTRNLLLALTAGEPFRVARSLALEACFRASGGRIMERRTRKLVDAAEALATRLEDPHGRALAEAARGISACFEGRFRAAIGPLERAGEALRRECAGVAAERAGVEMFTLWSLSFAGELSEFTRRVERGLEAADDRRDQVTATLLRTGHANLAWLLRDDPAGGREQVARAMSGWSQTDHYVQHHHALIAEAQIDLYLGDGESAAERVASDWRAIVDSQLLRVQFFRVSILDLRARSAIAAAATSSERGGFVRAAEDAIRRLASERGAWAHGLALLAEGSLLSVTGAPALAVTTLERAAAACDAAELGLHAAVAWRRAAALGSSAGERERGRVEAWMAAQGIADQGRIINLLSPGGP